MITLFPHQQKALNLTKPYNRVAYYLDMGLGKTFVGSEKLMTFNTRINLVVCQKTKIPDWLEHFRKYYPDSWTVDLSNSSGFGNWFSYKNAFGIKNVQQKFHSVLIINYDLIFRRPELKELEDFTLILDESSLIQNENTKRSKFILKLNPQNVILLSGTPTGGKYEKLWTQLHLLGWNISKELYWKQYIETEWVEQDGFFRQVVTGYKNVDRLKQKFADHGAIFMKDNDAGIILPEQTFIPVKVPAPKEYGVFMRKRIVTVEGKELVGDSALTSRLYARMLCGMYNKAKLEAFKDLVDSTDDRLIVFYNFTEELNKMTALVEGERPISILNGQFKDLEAYETEPNSVTFVQYQAGAMGVNLQKANRIIYFTPPDYSELYEQSKKRIHRIGQTQPCFYYVMSCFYSVEEDILANLQMRKDYTDDLFTAYAKTIQPGS